MGQWSKNSIAILSFNVEGVKGNAPFLQEIIPTFDFICLQEHWLWEFEKHTVAPFISDFNYHIRSVDSDFQKTHYVRSRGHGGVLIAWNKNLDNLIRVLEDGNNRIIAVEISSEPRPLCLVNCYMPTFGYKSTKFEYQECLDVLEFIISKYKNSHCILICGDMNATLLPQRSNDSDKQLRNFTQRNCLTTDCTIADKPTYIHGNGKSQIDYFLSSEDIIDHVSISQPNCTNSSSHLPISTTVNVTVKYIKSYKRVHVTNKRLLWEQADLNAYAECVGTLDVKIESPDQIVQYVELLQQNIVTATTNTVPSKQIRLNGPKWKASPEILCLLQKGRLLHKTWMNEGSPGVDHPLSIQRKALKKDIRSLQRRQIYNDRENFYDNLRQSDRSIGFYKLVKKSMRGSKSSYVVMKENDDIVIDFNNQCKGFASFYEDLAMPTECESFDTEYYDMVTSDMDTLRKFLEGNEEFSEITDNEIETAIKSLNNNKAADEYGITAEHIKYAKEALIPALNTLLNAIVEHEYVPDHFKGGIIHPILKRGKDKSQYQSYRGITVSSVLGKVLEIVIRNRIQTLLPSQQSDLQFGFTTGLSPTMAALVISEVEVESSERGDSLFIALLDSQRAFDVVNHDSLKRKLYLNGINNKFWKLINNWYNNLSAKVKWKGVISDSFPVLQGVRQGGILSTGFYKTYINDLLLSLENQQLGYCIGTTYVGCPTVADDVALLATSKEELQVMLDVVYKFSTRERYVIHPQKSMVIPKTRSSTVEMKWHLGPSDILVSDKGTHLGIIRAAKKELSYNVTERISCARKTLYSLMGTGLHGTNGLPPTQCLSMYTTYVLPRLLYGLEVYVPKQCDLNLLESFHIKMLRSIQALPPRSVKSITHLLLGSRPITAELHLRQLSLLGCILRSQNLTLKKIMTRQMYVKSENSKSWFIYIQNILDLYGLPKLELLMEQIPTKLQWKVKSKIAVDNFWNLKLISDCTSKISLIYCCFAEIKIGSPHRIWRSVNMNRKDIRRASVKCRMLIGTYTLQSDLKKYNGSDVEATCPLCHLEDEDLVHFLLKCNSLLQYRKQCLSDLQKLLGCNSKQNYWEPLRSEPLLLTCLILDAYFLVHKDLLPDDSELLQSIEVITRQLCFNLHCGRTFLINSCK